MDVQPDLVQQQLLELLQQQLQQQQQTLELLQQQRWQHPLRGQLHRQRSSTAASVLTFFLLAAFLVAWPVQFHFYKRASEEGLRRQGCISQHAGMVSTGDDMKWALEAINSGCKNGGQGTLCLYCENGDSSDTVVAPVLDQNVDFYSGAFENCSYSRYTPDSCPDPRVVWPGVAISCWLAQVATYAANVHCDVSLWGDYAEASSVNTLTSDTSILPTGTKLVIEFNSNYAKSYDPGEPVVHMRDLVVGLVSQAHRSAYTYPSGSFYLDFAVSASWRRVEGNRTVSSMVPLAFTWAGATVPGWTSTASRAEILSYSQGWAPNATTYAFTMYLSMRPILQAQVVMLITWFWLLAAGTLLAAVYRTCMRKAPSTDLLAFAGALLFALPAIRAFWPLAPSSGTGLDIIGLFAPLFVVTFAVLILLGDVMREVVE
jgi:hypothetical protein